MVVKCTANCGRNAILKRPKTSDTLCKECFYWAFETEVHETIINGKLFKRGDRVVIGASGGKDSTVLAYVMKTLNQRYDYGLELLLLSIDEGITGYRDDSLETVKQNRDDYEMPLKILSYKDLYGWTMDEIVAQIGRKNNCTFCGVFRRQALDRGASQLKADCIATGHNADDIAETVLMNVLRGDLPRLRRCTASITKGEEAVPRVKPLKYAYEKEIVLYAYHRKLLYFSTECVFAPNAYRGHARELLKDLERVRPSVILDLIHSGESLCVEQTARMPEIGICKKCGYVSSQEICKACFLLEGLNRGLPRLGVGKTSVSKRRLADELVKDAEKLCCGSGNCQSQNPCTSKNEQSVIAIGNAIKKIDIEDMLVNKTKQPTVKKHKQKKSKESNSIQTNEVTVEKQSNNSAHEKNAMNKVNQNIIDQKLEMSIKKLSNESVISVNERNITKEVHQIDQNCLEWKPNCNNCSQKCNCVSDDRSKFALIQFLKQLKADYSDDEIDAVG